MEVYFPISNLNWLNYMADSMIRQVGSAAPWLNLYLCNPKAYKNNFLLILTLVKAALTVDFTLLGAAAESRSFVSSSTIAMPVIPRILEYISEEY